MVVNHFTRSLNRIETISINVEKVKEYNKALEYFTKPIVSKLRNKIFKRSNL